MLSSPLVAAALSKRNKQEIKISLCISSTLGSVDTPCGFRGVGREGFQDRQGGTPSNIPQVGTGSNGFLCPLQNRLQVG